MASSLYPLTLNHYLVLGAILFAISVVGIFLNRRNIIVLLMAIELMLLAVNLNFIAFSRFLGDPAGQVFVFFILTVAAAESAIVAGLFCRAIGRAGAHRVTILSVLVSFVCSVFVFIQALNSDTGVLFNG